MNDLSLKLEHIEKELNSLKSMVIKILNKPFPKKIVSLKGLLGGISVNMEDFKEARKSLFKFNN